jgi:hypothetical protein
MEWWSYSLSDFLLFSPRTYYRLIERYNGAVWPGHILTLGVGLCLLVLLRPATVTRGRIISALLALLWIWVAWAFLWRRYATINWAARYLLPVFVLQTVLLVWTGAIRSRLRFIGTGVTGATGTALLVLSLAYPVVAPLVGRTWLQAEIFGIAPDPTAIGTAGLLLLTDGRARWELLAVPLLWCLVSGLTLWAMGSAEALLPPAVALIVIVAAALKNRKLGHQGAYPQQTGIQT